MKILDLVGDVLLKTRNETLGQISVSVPDLSVTVGRMQVDDLETLQIESERVLVQFGNNEDVPQRLKREVTNGSINLKVSNYIDTLIKRFEYCGELEIS